MGMEVLTPDGVRPKRRLFCRFRRRAKVGMAAFALTSLTFGPLVMQSCGGPIVQGNTYVNAWCSGGDTGEVSFTAVTTGFAPSVKIHYEYTVWFNGLHYFSDRSGDYYTDRYGTHNGMSRKTFSCGQHGVWRIYVVTISDDGRYNSSGSTTEVAC